MLLNQLRIGEGYDIHRTIVGRPLMLGGVKISDADFGLDGHSDADVLLHAIIDALLGGAGLGDIGEWFPNTEPEWKGADSAALLTNVVIEIEQRGWRIANLDCTIHAERPKLTLWKPAVRNRLSDLLRISTERINVKAKSGEKVGPIGRSEAIAANAVVLLLAPEFV